jgi:putative two-component system response regulator
VLIVDDDASARATLEALLRPMGLNTPAAASSAEALVKARELQPDLVLLDVMMPETDGFETCRQLRAIPETAAIPIVMVTALQDRESRLEGIEAGADDFLTKPVDRLELRSRVRTTLRLNRYRRERDQRQQLVDTMRGALAVMQDLLSLIDSESFGKSKPLEKLASTLGEALDYAPMWELTVAASLCQLGRVTLPNDVREKVVNGKRLTVPEKRMLTQIPETGGRLLQHLPVFQGVSKIVHWQDKHFDGVGFPFERCEGKDIPLGARILKLLRALLELEASGLSRTAALTALAGNEGHYDPEILKKAQEVLTNVRTIERLVTLVELKAGMITRSGIKDKRGRLLVGPGIPITEFLMHRLTYIHETRGIQQPFEVQIAEVSEA